MEGFRRFEYAKELAAGERRLRAKARQRPDLACGLLKVAEHCRRQADALLHPDQQARAWYAPGRLRN